MAENFTFAGPESNLDRSGGLDASPSSDWDAIAASTAATPHPALDLAPSTTSSTPAAGGAGAATGAATGGSLLGAQLRAQGRA